MTFPKYAEHTIYANNPVKNDVFITYCFILVGLYFLYKSYKKSFTQYRNLPNLPNLMKRYESHTEMNVSKVGHSSPFIVRLKGRNFKNIKNNEKYDTSMQKIGQELMREFHARTAMVFNDEIILVFSESEYHQFGGRCIKLQSIISSYASSSLTLKLNELCSFHCSVVDFTENKYELLNYIKWRNQIASSLHKPPQYIKKQFIEPIESIQSYRYIQFGLPSIHTNYEYMDLFTTDDFVAYDYKIKFNNSIYM
jgi:hypothetical protein